MILEVLTDENPLLRKTSKKIDDISDEKIRELAINMIKTMKKENGIGLAAPQVGELVRMIVIDVKDGAIVLINPKIKKYSRETETCEEGCLSVPKVYRDIERSVWIKYEAYDLNGNKSKEKAEGLLARVIQHEVDHLDGVLITDK